MTFHAIASLFISLSSIGLGIFVYLGGRKKPANITLSLYTLSVAFWSFGQFMAEISASKGAALFWSRIHLGGAIFIPVFYIHFVLAFLQKTKEKSLAIGGAYLIALLFLLTDFTPLYVADVAPKLIFRYYPVAGVAFSAFAIIFFLLVGYGFYNLLKALKTSTGVVRNQIIYIIFASVIGFGGGSMMFLPVFNINIIPIGYYFVPFYILIAIYAIVRHRLLDITIVIRRGLIYSTLTAIFTVLYIGTILLFKELFQSATGFNSLIATILVLFGFAIFFQPLRERVQEWIDRIFFKGKYDYQKTLKDLSGAVVSILDCDELINKIVDTIRDTMKVENIAVMLFEEKANQFITKRAEGFDNIDLQLLPAYFEKEKQTIIYDEPEGGVLLSIPLIAKGNLKGILNLGEKLSHDMYSDEDINLLSTLANQTAIAIENAELHENIIKAERELSYADKLASLGTLSAGMAHEIKNPLASIKGLTQVLPENISDPEFISKFTDIVPRQLDRINGIIEALLKFGRPSKLLIREVDVNSILEDALSLVERECRSHNILILKEFEEEPSKIKGDYEQLTQAFLNLILNAIQAMPKGGKLKLKSQKAKGKNIIEISDTGVGIPEDKIKNIFDPFFTTKDSGAGLGLAVTYRIIKEHGGKIEVKSKLGEGATFTLAFTTQLNP